MAKERKGMVFERVHWFGAVEYIDTNGNRKRIERKAKSKKHAVEVAEHLSLELKESLGKSVKIKQFSFSKSAGWYARVTITDESGKRRDIWRKGENKSDAKELVKQVIRELDEHGDKALTASQMTFNDLAAYYEKTYLIEPQYVDGRKVAGLRSLNSLNSRIKALKEFFDKRKLRAITHGDIERFRVARLKTPVVLGKNKKKGEPKTRQRSVASVNRELSLLRRILNVAKQNKWIAENPFDAGEPLIRPGDEKPRERIITRDEETKLLAACTGRRAHLRFVVICALDTGMRKGEILKLRWSDLDFENGIIAVRAFNTKTMRERQVAMTERLAFELSALYEKSTKDPDALVFGITDDVKRSFNFARKVAGLPDVRFHDLRHTHATRLVSAHIPLSEVGRVLGHTQANTTYRYVNANVETARRAAAALDDFNRSANENEAKQAAMVH